MLFYRIANIIPSDLAHLNSALHAHNLPGEVGFQQLKDELAEKTPAKPSMVKEVSTPYKPKSDFVQGELL